VPVMRGAKEFGSIGEVRVGLEELALIKAKTWLRTMTWWISSFTNMDEERENFRDTMVLADDGEEMGDVKILTASRKAAGEHCYRRCCRCCSKRAM